MKYFPLVWAGIWRKPLRTCLTLLSIIVAFVLFGLLASIEHGFTQQRAAAKLDRLVIDPRFGAPMPMTYADEIRRVPGVTVVSGFYNLGGYFQDPKNAFALDAVTSDFFKARSELTASPAEIAALAARRTGAIATIAAAKKYGWRVGDKIPVNSAVAQTNGSTVWTFDLLSICDDADHPGVGQYLIVNYDYFDEARAIKKGMVGRFILRIQDPAQTATINAAVDALFSTSSVPTRTTSETANLEANQQALGDINFLVGAVGGAVLFMLLFLTGNNLMQSVRERTPEFGILKTLGFSDGAVVATVLFESSLIFLFGAVVGLGLALVVVRFAPQVTATTFLIRSAPTLLLPRTSVVIGLALSLVAATASAFMPAWRVRRLNVVEALRPD